MRTTKLVGGLAVVAVVLAACATPSTAPAEDFGSLWRTPSW